MVWAFFIFKFKRLTNFKMIIKMEKLIITNEMELEEIVSRAISKAIGDVKAPEVKKSLTRNEFCKKHNICRSTLRNWERDGIITSTKIGGRYYYDADATTQNSDSNAR